MTFSDYIDAGHFVLISMFLIVIGALLLTWNHQCKDNELKNQSTSSRLKTSGASLVATGSVALVLSVWLFTATMWGTRRCKAPRAAQPQAGYYNEYRNLY